MKISPPKPTYALLNSADFMTGYHAVIILFPFYTSLALLFAHAWLTRVMIMGQTIAMLNMHGSLRGFSHDVVSSFYSY